MWAVLSSDEYRSSSLTPEAEDRFWQSGEEHVAHVLAILRNEIAPQFAPRVALDFGCGVGRALVPLARRCDRVFGLDASPTMVARARRHLDACGVANAEVHPVGRTIGSEVLGGHRVDFVHSVLVFQHIVAVEGLALFDQLLELLEPGGLGFVQFQCRNPGGDLERAIRALRLRYRWFNALCLKSRIPLFRDLVMLYEYDMTELLRRLADHRVAEVVVERTDAGPGGYAARLYFAKHPGSEEEYDATGRSMKVRMRP